jgi:hypothetical protein
MHNKGFGGEYGYDEKSKTNLDFMKILKVWGGIIERIVMSGGGEFLQDFVDA